MYLKHFRMLFTKIQIFLQSTLCVYAEIFMLPIESITDACYKNDCSVFIFTFQICNSYNQRKCHLDRSQLNWLTLEEQTHKIRLPAKMQHEVGRTSDLIIRAQ